MANLPEKICTKCKTVKPLGAFYSRDGRAIARCKGCTIEDVALYERANPEKINEYQRLWNIAHPGRAKERNIQWCKENAERKRLICNLWAKNNPERIRMYRQQREANERDDPKKILGKCMKRLMGRSLKGAKAGRRWEELAGYTSDRLVSHMEKLFRPGMTWENHGPVWHIDHKIPIAVFNYEKPEDLDFKRCWDLKNLQPLWAKDNIRKNAKIDKPFQPSLAIGGV